MKLSLIPRSVKLMGFGLLGHGKLLPKHSRQPCSPNPNPEVPKPPTLKDKAKH